MDEEIKDVLLNVGMDLRNKIVQKINSNIPPPNAPSTVKKKKSSKTLIDSSTLLTSVDSHLISEEFNTLEVATGVFDEGVAQYAAANEYGSTRVLTNKNADNPDEMHQGYSVLVIPERSFMRSTYDQEIDELLNNAEEEISNILSKRFLGK